MLNYLKAYDALQRRIIHPVKEMEPVPERDVEPLGTADLDHSGILVHSHGLVVRLAQNLEHFAAPAAYVDHFSGRI